MRNIRHLYSYHQLDILEKQTLELVNKINETLNLCDNMNGVFNDEEILILNKIDKLHKEYDEIKDKLKLLDLEICN